MCHLDLFRTLPEVKAHREGQPLALTIAMGAVYPDDSIHLTLTFYRYLINR